MCLGQTPGRRRPLINGRFVNDAVGGPALDAISIRASVVCVPLLLCAGWRQHTYCAVPSLLLKTGNNTPYPSLLGLRSKGASLPYVANEKAAATLFMVTRWRHINTFLCCWMLDADGLLSSRVPQQYTT